jgi:hypothetical protein
MIEWEEFRERVRKRKAERWVDTLLSEPPGRVAGRRPRDAEQEALLGELDRLRLAKSALHRSARRLPVDRSDA